MMARLIVDRQDLKVLSSKLQADACTILDMNGDGIVDGEDVKNCISKDVKISFQKILDVNGDGKVDDQDLNAQSRIHNILDMNNNGKVDEKDVKAAFVLA